MHITLSVTSGPAKGKTFNFTEANSLLFGKSPEAHVQIPDDPMVSRNHFYLLIEASACRVRDLESTNGTYVGRAGRFKRYGGKTPLPPGAVAAPDAAVEAELADDDVISVGDTKMAVKIERPAQVTEIQDTAPDDFGGTMVQSSAPTEIGVCSNPLPHMPDVAPPGPATPLRPEASFEVLYPHAPKFVGYEMLAMIGQGGMGVVVKARQLATGRVVAIKTIRTEKGGDMTKLVQAFDRSISITAQLKHDHIVEQLDVVRTGAVLGEVMEYVDGMDLMGLIKSCGGKVPLNQAAPLMLEICSGLACAHAAGVVHRDLKPENIFLAKNGAGWKAKVADFGLAKKYEATGSSLFGVAGTPPYWPREHVTAYARLYPASDVFSIAAVFYFMLVGIHARDGMSDLLKRVKRPGFGDYSKTILSGKVVPIRQRLPQFPEAVASVLDRALREDVIPREIQDNHDELRAKLADLRYANAGALRDALVSAFKRCGV